MAQRLGTEIIAAVSDLLLQHEHALLTRRMRHLCTYNLRPELTRLNEGGDRFAYSYAILMLEDEFKGYKNQLQ